MTVDNPTGAATSTGIASVSEPVELNDATFLSFTPA
jgi:hypothetical protein